MPQVHRVVELPALHTTRTRSTKNTKPPVTEFEIVLYDRPHYTPNQTLPQTPITLIPPHDTDAFIVDKVVTPFDVPPEQEQTVQRVLNYVVGWPDLPYVRYLVPCTQVLDYVSPRVLEEWEYALVVRQRAQREEVELSKQRKGTKRGREGSSNSIDAHKDQQAQVKQSRRSPKTNIPVPTEQHRGRGPHKRCNRSSLLAKDAKNMTEANVMAAAPTMARIQAHEQQPPPSVHFTAQRIPSIAAGNQRTGLSLTRPFQQLAENPPVRVESSNEGAGGAETTDMGAATTGDDAEDIDMDMADSIDEWLEEDRLVGTVNEMDRESAQRKTVKISSQDISQSIRRVSYVAPSHIPIQLESQMTRLPLPKISEMPSPQKQVSRNSPTGAETQVSQARDVCEGPANNGLSKHKDTESEVMYEVDRLEDDWISTADSTSKGQPTRLFLVRWKGDWPPDQNPTWEPAENLPPRMIRQYLKRKAQ